jgi:hypothetical protein
LPYGFRDPWCGVPFLVIAILLVEESKKVLFCAVLAPLPFNNNVVYLKYGSVVTSEARPVALNGPEKFKFCIVNAIFI